MKKIVVAVVLAFAGLLLLSGAAASAPPGWNGTVKIHEGNDEPDPVTRDEPKVCTFHIHGFNFDPEQEITWWILAGNPFKGTPVLTDKIVTNTDGVFATTEYALSDGHYKLFWAEPGQRQAKHKVFKVICDPTPSASPSESPSPTQTPVPSPTSTPRPTPIVVGSPTPSPSPSESSETSPTPSIPSGPNLTPPPTDTETTGQDTSPYTGPLFILAALGTLAYLLIWKFKHPYRS